MIKFDREDIPAVPSKQIIRFYDIKCDPKIEGEIVKYLDQHKSKLMKLVLREDRANSSSYCLFSWEAVEQLLEILNNLLMKRKEIDTEIEEDR